VAVLAAILATVLLSALGLAIALLGIGEMTLASRERTARSLRLAAEGGAQAALIDLATFATWDPVLARGGVDEASGVRARFSEIDLAPPAPWSGRPLDLRALTLATRTASDALRGPADAVQRWRLFAWAPFERLVPGAGSGPWYVVVWVADDRADTDGDADRDSNGLVTVRAVALGPDDASAALEATLAREAGRVRAVAIRPRP
jgi:hypothetical protein